MTRTYHTLALATLASLGLAAALPQAARAQNNLLANGGFEDEGPVSGYDDVSPGATTIPGWTADTGTDAPGDSHGVVLTGTYWQAASGTNSVELNNNYNGGYGSGGLFQDVSVTPGQTYTLTFSKSGQPNAGPAVKQADVFWYDPTAAAAPGTPAATDTFDASGHTLSDMGWTPEGPLTLTATAATMRLRFVGTVPAQQDGGFAIDDVSLVAAAPEPSQTSALGLGVLGLGALALKARKRNAA